MKRIPEAMSLADLLYGHSGRYIQQLKKPYDPSRAAGSPISLGELKCGCWIVLDGNNRTGLLLSAKPEATVADYPSHALVVLRKGRWDETTELWNSTPKTFAEVMRAKERKKSVAQKGAGRTTFYGFIERGAGGDFYGVITSTRREGGAIEAHGGTPAQVEGRLRVKLRRRFTNLRQSDSADIDIQLAGLAEASYVHVCGLTAAVKKRR